MKVEKPNFLIVGSAKCGTTALASILSNHPDCCMADPKEVCFFQDSMDYKPNPNFDKGWSWYREAFGHYEGEAAIGEATPSYSDRSRSPLTAKRIYDFNPQMRIIYMVRDPLARQISAWKMQWVFGKEGSSPWRREDSWALEGFETWMKKQREVKEWDECRYKFQLSAYQEFFPKNQICVSFLEDWKQEKDAEVARIMEFLELDPSKRDVEFREAANRGQDRVIERPFLRRLRYHPAGRKLIDAFPSSLRQYARERIAKHKVLPPEAELSQALRAEFLDYVASDCREVLKEFGKDETLWNLK
ncbi:sulfotransferase family protein [Haloferula chungangensis]|uniref:Sulfotransferase family protein n=1 Tax=Haloferula chungangensis TaxID=1048331 RepID=A0ABW2L9I6_9BACT